MSNTPRVQNIQAAEELDLQHSAQTFLAARDFFHATPSLFVAAEVAPPPTESWASGEGQIQFHLIGQKTDDPKYSDIMNENQDNLLSIGGLVHDYMTKTYPKVTSQKLDISTWLGVVKHVPDLAIGTNQNKTFHQEYEGVKISGQFLSLVASAVITEGASLLTDFQKWLQKVGDITFSKNTKDQTYKVTAVTYQSYLVENGAGGYYDYGSLVLRQIDFKSHFLELNGACVDVKKVVVDMAYVESVSLLQTRRIRKGGPDYARFQALVNANSTKVFKDAENFFNGGGTPQKDLTPKV